MTDPNGSPRVRPHPPLLPWYVAGTLEPEALMGIEKHLPNCRVCSDEVAALRSMRNTLRTRVTPHPAVEELVGYESGGLDRHADRKRMVEGHLEGCADCRHDIEALQHTQDEPTPRMRVRTLPRWALPAAAIMVAFPLIALGLRSMRAVPKPALVEVTPVPAAFQVLRDSRTPSYLTGAGPWSLRVLLPALLADREYSVCVRDVQGRVVHDLGKLVSDEAVLSFVIPSGSGAGEYVLEIRPSGSLSGAAYDYPFILGETKPQGSRER